MLRQVQESRHKADHRAFFVVNPGSGKGKISSVMSSINRYFPEEMHEIYRLGSREDIAEVVKEVLKEGFNTIVAVGGDGTVSRVASALVGTDMELGIVPTGTANMLARELGIPVGSNHACSLIASPHENVKLDAMSVNGRPFIYQLVVGYSSLVMARMHPKHKRLFGRSIFLLSGLRHMVDLQPYEFAISVDGTSYKFTATEIIVANAGILGVQPFRLGKRIKPDDGKLDLIVMKGKSAASFIAGGTEIVFGKDGHSRYVEHLTGRNMVIRSDQDIDVKVDGETLGTTPTKLDILPGAVRAIIPPERCETFPSCGEPVGRSLFRSRIRKMKKSAEGEIRTPVV